MSRKKYDPQIAARMFPIFQNQTQNQTQNNQKTQKKTKSKRSYPNSIKARQQDKFDHINHRHGTTSPSP